MPTNQDKTRSTVTVDDERVGLPYSARLVAGAGITLTLDQALGTYTIAAGAGGGGSFTSLALTGILAPAQLPDATTENWNPGVIAGAVARVEFTTAGASAAIGGLLAAADGTVVILTNKGANILTALNQSAGSLAANQLGLNGDLIIPPKASLWLIYSTAVGCWSGIST